MSSRGKLANRHEASRALKVAMVAADCFLVGVIPALHLATVHKWVLRSSL